MIRFLLRLFPTAWRDRYGEELVALVDDTGLDAGTVADVARAGVNERARSARAAIAGGGTMTIGPAWRHPTLWAAVGLLVLVPTMTFVLLSMLTYQLGLSGLAATMEPVNRWLDSQRLADLVLVAAPGIAFIVAAAPLVRLTLATADGEPSATLGLRLRAINLVVASLALAVGALLVGHIVWEAVLQQGA